MWKTVGMWILTNLIRSEETNRWAEERDRLKAERLELEARMGRR